MWPRQSLQQSLGNCHDSRVGPFIIVRHYNYRCCGMDAYRFGGQRVCANRQVRTDLLDVAVWREVEQLLEDPARLMAEYQRRLLEACHPQAGQEGSLAMLEAQIAKLRRGVGRLIDSYAEGTIDKAEFEPRIRSLKERVTHLEEQRRVLVDSAARQTTLSLIIGRLEDFARTVQNRLAELDWAGKRELIRTLVKRVEIGLEEVDIVFRVAPAAAGPQPIGSGTNPCLDSRSWQDCGRRDLAAVGQHLPDGHRRAIWTVVSTPPRAATGIGRPPIL